MSAKKIKEGIYRGVLLLNKETNTELPFNFEVKYSHKKPKIIIHNADERIEITEITIKGDSVNFKLPIFDTEFKTQRIGNNLKGLWINHYRNTKNTIEFTATFNEPRRFLVNEQKSISPLEGKWEATFSPASTAPSKAIALFHHQEQTNFICGTFLTETGDYRYLEGVQNNNTFYLSCFDGSHAFLFTGNYENEKIVGGKFYSGTHWEENWEAIRNNNFKLRDASQITFVKDKSKPLNFSFPSVSGNTISLSAERYKNKPIIIQLMGSWCPNCMDESVYLTDLYKQYKPQGLEIIALAFEKTEDFETAKKQVLRLKNRFNIEYELLITQKTGKSKAAETLPMLNDVLAFPTTLFLNKNHEVVKIHTGFSGPATGQEYEQFKSETEAFITNLIKQ